MKTINHECYVELEVANLLKEAGFDWECRKIYYCYHEDGDIWELEDNYKNHRYILELDYCLLAPTLDVAQRWLREVKNMPVNVISYSDTKTGNTTGYCYQVYERTTGWVFNHFSYEKALEAGIKKALEIILEKGE